MSLQDKDELPIPEQQVKPLHVSPPNRTNLSIYSLADLEIIVKKTAIYINSINAKEDIREIAHTLNRAAHDELGDRILRLMGIKS